MEVQSSFCYSQLAQWTELRISLRTSAHVQNTLPIKMHENILKPLYSNKIYLEDKDLELKELTLMSSE